MRFPEKASSASLWPDHVNHSVADFSDACARMEQLGFTLSPRSDQLAPDAAGELKPTGMANRCVMLEEGYIEVSGTVGGDSPAVRAFRELVEKYVGVHLLALGTMDPEYQVGVLPDAGFAPASMMNYQRMVEVEGGEELARFTLAITPKELLPEARLLMVRHETPQVIWQQRWVSHANGATGLREVVFVSDDMGESTDRFARFTGVTPAALAEGQRFDLERGQLTLLTSDVASRYFPALPAAPCVAGYVVTVASLQVLSDLLASRGVELSAQGDGWLAVEGGPNLGSVLYFAEAGATLPWYG